MAKPFASLSGLLDFEAAARHGGFRAAAVELHKTPAALSQQIKLLERSLGLALFVRHARHVAVTPAGRALAVNVTRMLGELREQVQALRETQDPHTVRVSGTHSLTMKFLVPRLHAFTAAHPAVDVRVEASDQMADLAGGGCDIALRYQALDAMEGPPLYAEQQVVVYSPALLAKPLPLAGLLRQPLLHEEGGLDAWHRLLAREGLAARRHLDFSRAYSHGGLLVQAATAGLGVGLVPFALAAEDLAQGRLVRADCPPLASAYGYRLLRGSARSDAPAVDAFEAWIRAEFGRLTPAAPARTRGR
ncbi:LysR family glycine cleavage system transcriptional activator [Pelomonas saccharophila]|uniref:LysR family glycine cleavage system transcriptional activator n=1 Tax=Roseateles saccharophilus TaxID=304 RepID=A0ABU1YJB5_ROSSA|nr:LysR substrate-binding domain-containing protein [Roseateles saccharophilus]MDR7268944.1 LysR family glycine cleavage system transcriptional activator [Roseateles saccharophilus]